MPDSISTIDLTRYHSRGVRLMSGRDRGVAVRKSADLDVLDAALTATPGSTVTVQIPAEVIFVSSSFYLGLFGPSIRRFGAQEFEERFLFEGPHSESNLRVAIREAIHRGNLEAVKRNSPLPAVPA